MSVRFFRTKKDAHGALCQDCGFDPFLNGGWGRCTIMSLAEAGYVIDPKKWQEQEAEEEDRRRRIQRPNYNGGY